MVGETNGADFPTTPGAYQPTFNEPSATINRGWDAFVTRFNAAGSQMVFSTYLGAAPIFDPSSRAPGRRRGKSAAVVVDATDSVIVAGYTTSEKFPTTPGAYQSNQSKASRSRWKTARSTSRHRRLYRRLNPNGTQLTYSTYLGGQSDDIVKDMVIDATGRADAGRHRGPARNLRRPG